MHCASRALTAHNKMAAVKKSMWSNIINITLLVTLLVTFKSIDWSVIKPTRADYCLLNVHYLFLLFSKNSLIINVSSFFSFLVKVLNMQKEHLYSYNFVCIVVIQCLSFFFNIVTVVIIKKKIDTAFSSIWITRLHGSTKVK